MDKLTAKAVEDRVISESRTALDKIVREGARRMLQEALENEVADYHMGSDGAGNPDLIVQLS